MRKFPLFGQRSQVTAGSNYSTEEGDPALSMQGIEPFTYVFNDGATNYGEPYILPLSVLGYSYEMDSTQSTSCSGRLWLRIEVSRGH